MRNFQNLLLFRQIPKPAINFLRLQVIISLVALCFANQFYQHGHPNIPGQMLQVMKLHISQIQGTEQSPNQNSVHKMAM